MFSTIRPHIAKKILSVPGKNPLYTPEQCGTIISVLIPNLFIKNVKKGDRMKPFNKEIFDNLAQVHDKHCISIYMNPVNQDSDKESKSVIKLKNIIKRLRNDLEDREMKKWEAEEYLKPLNDLLDNTNDLWRYPSEGIAIYYHGGDLNIFNLPFSFQEKEILSDHYYLLPMAEMINQNWTYYLLELSIKDVKLFKGDLFTLNQISLPENMPTSMSDAVGGDYEEKTLQYRAGQDFHGGSIYHGHGSGSTHEKKDEIHKFCKAIDRELNNMIDNKNIPLIVASVDYVFSIYRSENNYPNLSQEGIYGNHEGASVQELHSKAVQVLMPEIAKNRKEEKARFHKLLNKGMSSNEPDNVVPASIAGRIETLFVNVNGELNGRYQPDSHSIEKGNGKPGNVDLINKAAIETVLHDGRVFLESNENMPDETSPVNAIFRY